MSRDFFLSFAWSGVALYKIIQHIRCINKNSQRERRHGPTHTKLFKSKKTIMFAFAGAPDNLDHASIEILKRLPIKPETVPPSSRRVPDVSDVT
jgi:hypothetical protein